MLRILFLLILLLSSSFIHAQINPSDVQIARDEWGVPHIFAPTDAGVAYGFAWAIAEDDFASLQIHLLAAHEKLSSVKGKSGAILDVIAHLTAAREVADTAYREGVYSKEYQKVMSGYIQGINDYASTHPKEVWLKEVFPISEKDLITAYIFNFALFANIDEPLTKIFNGSISKDEVLDNQSGSNAFAISRKNTVDNKTYFDINSHQPLEGPFAWYEAHLCSEEGWNIIGGIIPGGTSIGHGTNQYLGWAHTVNKPDFNDVYKLEINPDNPLEYKFDDHWETLEARPLKIKVKVGFLKIGKTFKNFYWSKYGTTIKDKKGNCYALRFASNTTIKMPEQHYWMNKAKNFTEFKSALNIQGLACFNLVYADREDNIFYISNGLIPHRDSSYQWNKVLPGNTSKTLWEPDFYKVDQLPQVLNPPSGYVFNTNNTPFNATAKEDNIKPENYSKTMGYELHDNNRSLRLSQLLEDFKGKKMSYEDFKKIKYDVQYIRPLYSPYFTNIEDIFKIDPEKYPALKEIITKFQLWNGAGETDNQEASIFMLVLHHIIKSFNDQKKMQIGGTVSEKDIADAFQFAKNHLIKHFKSIHVPLSDIQKHTRGDVALPMRGVYDMIAAMYSKPDKKGIFRTQQGESYIMLVRYSKEGVELETINAYGSSSHKESPHYQDQMPLYTNKGLKKMTFDKETILKEAKRIYHPME